MEANSVRTAVLHYNNGNSNVKDVYDEKVFEYNQLSIEDEIGSLDYNDINILFWIKDYINEGIKNL